MLLTEGLSLLPFLSVHCQRFAAIMLLEAKSQYQSPVFQILCGCMQGIEFTVGYEHSDF